MTTTAAIRGQRANILRKIRAHSPVYYLGECVIWALMLFVAAYEMLPILWMFATSLRLPPTLSSCRPASCPPPGTGGTTSRY